MDLTGLSFAFHIIGMNLWIGAAFLLAIAIIPALKRLGEEPQMEFLKTFNRYYIPAFIIGGIMVGITGWYQTFSMLDDLNLTAAYIKHGVIVLLIIASVILWLFLSPRLTKPAADRQKVWNWFVALAWIQAALGLIILFLTGWLTQ